MHGICIRKAACRLIYLHITLAVHSSSSSDERTFTIFCTVNTVPHTLKLLTVELICRQVLFTCICAELRVDYLGEADKVFSQKTMKLLYRPLHGIRHRKIRSSQCACRGQKVHSIPLNCVLTREFLFKTKCLLVASWTVKIAPVLESSFSGFLQDLIRLKKIDDIRVCKLLNGQTGTIRDGYRNSVFNRSRG